MKKGGRFKKLFVLSIFVLSVFPLSALAKDNVQKVSFFERILVNPLASLFEPLFTQPTPKTIVLTRTNPTPQVAGTSTPLIITASGMSKEEILSYINSSLASVSSSAPTIQNITNTYVRSGGAQGLANTTGTSFADVQARIDALASAVSTAGLNVSGASVFSGNVGIGTTTPWAQLSVNPNGITGPAFAIGSSTATNFVVTNGGRVGIGTTDPSSQLHVVAATETLGNLFFDTYTAGSFTTSFAGRTARGTPSSPSAVQNGDALVSFGGRGYGTTGFSGSHRGRLTFWAAESWTDSAQGTYATINTTSIGAAASSERLRITAGGDVGIGNTTPAYTLTVASSTNSQLSLSAGAGIAQWTFRNAGGNFYLSTTTVAGTATSSTPALTILGSNGSVGIGTNPTAKLEVVSRGEIDQAIVANMQSTSGVNYALNATASGVGATRNTALYGWASGATENRGLWVESGKAIINDKLGIGTTTPYYTLSVASSTGPQFALSERAGVAQWTFRNAGGNFYLATSTIAGTATTSTSAFSIIGSSGNVGIGTAAPSAPLSIVTSRSYGSAPAAGTASLLISDSSSNASQRILFKGFSGIDMASIDQLDTGSSLSALAFFTPSSINVLSERMRIAASGNIGIATTTPWKTLSVNGGVAMSALSNDSTGYYVCLNTTNYTLATSTTACGASSQKYKENISDLSYGLNEVLKLRPVSFDYKDSYLKNARRQVGFIAEEVATVTPEVVAYDDNGEIQGLDYPKFTAIIVKAVQELEARFRRMTGWFVFRDNNLCVDEVCMTKEQFKEMMLRSGVGATQTSSQGSGVGGQENINTSTTTSTSTPNTVTADTSTSTPETATTTPVVIEETATSTAAASSTPE